LQTVTATTARTASAARTSQRRSSAAFRGDVAQGGAISGRRKARTRALSAKTASTHGDRVRSGADGVACACQHATSTTATTGSVLTAVPVGPLGRTAARDDQIIHISRTSRHKELAVPTERMNTVRRTRILILRDDPTKRRERRSPEQATIQPS
jgi:hypothetical protein